MNLPTGIVESLITGSGGCRAVVAVDVRAACPRCAAGKGCGAGLLIGAEPRRQVVAAVGPKLEVAAGDEVAIRLAPSSLLRAALLVYGLPMLGALAGAGLAYLLQSGDGIAAGAALAGIAGGLLAGRRHLRNTACLETFVPIVEKRLSTAEPGR